MYDEATALEIAKEEAWEDGLEEGEKRGEKLEKMKIAKKLLKNRCRWTK